MTIFFFLISCQLMRHPLIELFHLSNLLQMPNSCRMVNIEFFVTSHVVVGSVLMMALSCSLSTSDGRPLCSLSSRLSSPLQNFLNRHCTIHSLVVPSPNVLLMLQVVSASLQPIFNSNKKIIRICFLSNNVSIVKINIKETANNKSLEKRHKVRNAH